MNKVEHGPLHPIVVAVVETYDAAGAHVRTAYHASGAGVEAVSYERDLAISRCLSKLEGSVTAKFAAKAQQREVS